MAVTNRSLSRNYAPVQKKDENKYYMYPMVTGGVMLLIGNLGAEADAKIDASKLTCGEAVDLMSGKVLGKGGIYTVKVEKESFAIVLIKP